jgi:hypothetical protein
MKIRADIRAPQAWQVKRGSMSDSRASSGHGSLLIAVQWLHW